MNESPTNLTPSSSYTVTDRLTSILVLFRPQQYYKNLLIFFGIFFSENFFRVDLWIPIIIGFITLCLVSSLNYIINDLRDREKDRHHPEKSHRPFPSGRISSSEAILLIIALIIIICILVFVIPLSTDEIYLAKSISLIQFYQFGDERGELC